MVKGTSLLSSEKKLRAGGWARVGERGRTWGQSDIRLLYLYNINKIHTHTHTTHPIHAHVCMCMCMCMQYTGIQQKSDIYKGCVLLKFVLLSPSKNKKTPLQRLQSTISFAVAAAVGVSVAVVVAVRQSVGSDMSHDIDIDHDPSHDVWG